MKRKTKMLFAIPLFTSVIISVFATISYGVQVSKAANSELLGILAAMIGIVLLGCGVFAIPTYLEAVDDDPEPIQPKFYYRDTDGDLKWATPENIIKAASKDLTKEDK